MGEADMVRKVRRAPRKIGCLHCCTCIEYCRPDCPCLLKDRKRVGFVPVNKNTKQLILALMEELRAEIEK